VKPWIAVAALLISYGHAEEKPRLSTAAELRALSPEEADRPLPARIRGVVTYVEQDYNMLYVQDETGGTYVGGERNVIEPSNFNRALQSGDLVEIEGVTNRGKFIPHLDGGEEGLRIRVLDQSSLPKPLRPQRGEVFNPKLHNQWVEIEAFATGMRHGRRWTRYSMILSGKPFEALVLGDWEHVQPPRLTGSDLRIRGVYGATFNEQREMTGMNLLVPSIDQIEVIDPGLTSAFSQPIAPIQELRQFQPGPLERAHVRGIVTWSEKDHGFYLADDSGALWVDPVENQAPPVEAAVEVVGFPSIDGAAMRLRDAVVRQAIEPAGPSEPMALTVLEAQQKGLHGNLVRLEGEVADRVKLEHTHLLILTNEPVSFQARLVPDESAPNLPPPGAWVTVTGIYERLNLEESESPARFQILLRNPADIQPLRAPSWWTVQRVAWITAGLAVVVLAALAWAMTLRRRVAAQTEIIGQQIESRRLAEERSRIGRELHDTLEQHLTGVALQIDTAFDMLPDSATAARTSLDTASGMLAHSRQEARRSVWDLKNPMLEQRGLPGALEELSASRRTPGVEFSLETPENWERLPEKTEFHLLRIAQEAVSNALKHAGASKLDLILTPSELTIRDNGCGFDPSRTPGDGRLHFGLAGMRERAGKLNASLQIDAKPDQGTAITIRLPES